MVFCVICLAVSFVTLSTPSGFMQLSLFIYLLNKIVQKNGHPTYQYLGEKIDPFKFILVIS